MEKSAKKRPGRPPGRKAAHRPVVSARVPETLYAQIKEEARKNGRTMGEELVWRAERIAEWQNAFGEAQKLLADARQITANELRSRLQRDGWTPVTGVGGDAWFEPGTNPNQWFVSNTPQSVVEDIAERAAMRAIQKVMGK